MKTANQNREIKNRLILNLDLTLIALKITGASASSHSLFSHFDGTAAQLFFLTHPLPPPGMFYWLLIDPRSTPTCSSRDLGLTCFIHIDLGDP